MSERESSLLIGQEVSQPVKPKMRWVDRLRSPSIALRLSACAVTAAVSVVSVIQEVSAGSSVPQTGIVRTWDETEQVNPNQPAKLLRWYAGLEQTQQDAVLRYIEMTPPTTNSFRETRPEQKPDSVDTIESSFNLGLRQITAVAMLGLMAFGTARFLARTSRAFIDPKGDIRLARPKKKDEEHKEVEEITEEEKIKYGLASIRTYMGNLRKVNRQDRLEALVHTIVTDPQNGRSAMAVSGLCAAAIIGLEGGQMGSIQLNLTLSIASLLAAIQPSFAAFARYSERGSHEVIQKTAAYTSGGLFGIIAEGLLIGSKDMAMVNAFFAGMTFLTLFKFAEMSIGSRAYVKLIWRSLQRPEALTRFDAFLDILRIPNRARHLEEALIIGDREAIFESFADDPQKRPLLAVIIEDVRRALKDEKKDPAKLIPTLEEWEEDILPPAIEEFLRIPQEEDKTRQEKK